jgi:uncharacterized protein YndB with AHSA1/START domain
MLTQFKNIISKVYTTSPPSKIFQILSTNNGRRSFWAESAEEIDGHIHFQFPNGQSYKGKIVKSVPDSEFSLIYFDTLVTFKLLAASSGTIVTLINEDVPAAEYAETKAGWVSVLLALKAFADFGVDLRNHSPERSWDQGFVDN